MRGWVRWSRAWGRRKRKVLSLCSSRQPAWGAHCRPGWAIYGGRVRFRWHGWKGQIPMTSLAAYRTDVRNLLAAAPDVATWPDGIIDQALRLGLLDFDPHLVYETSVTVTSAGHEQDLSSLPGLLTVFAVAYPWDYIGRFHVAMAPIHRNMVCRW